MALLNEYFLELPSDDLFSGVAKKINTFKVLHPHAELIDITNVEFFVGKAEEVLPREYEKNGVYADVIVVDPPRKGCDEVLLQTILKMQPERVVYVSCDSATLARDLRYLCDHGYELLKVCGVDQFPQTVHVETVVGLQRKDT